MRKKERIGGREREKERKRIKVVEGEGEGERETDVIFVPTALELSHINHPLIICIGKSVLHGKLLAT